MAARRFALLVLALSGCAAGLHLEQAEPPGPARFVDPDLAADVALAAPPNGAETLALALSNRSRSPIEVRLAELALVGPDHRLRPLTAGAPPLVLPPGASRSLQLAPAIRLAPGQSLQLILPTVIRGTERVYHLRLRVRRGAS